MYITNRIAETFFAKLKLIFTSIKSLKKISTCFRFKNVMNFVGKVSFGLKEKFLYYSWKLYIIEIIWRFFSS